MAAEFTDANFQEKVLSSDKLTVIDFWAEWCGPCRAIGPVIEELSKEYNGKVNIGKVNVDHNPQLSVNYGITSIPAILFIKNGKVVDKLVGAQPKSNFVKRIEAAHKRYTTAPVVAGNFFVVGREVDITTQGFGRIQINEIMLYEVKDGEIVSEQFFY